MSLRLAELSGEKRLDQVPGDGWSHGPAAHAKDVHVIVLDTLPGREVVVDQRRVNAPNFICAHRRAYAAATDRNSTLHLQRGYGQCQRDDIVGIVITVA